MGIYAWRATMFIAQKDTERILRLSNYVKGLRDMHAPTQLPLMFTAHVNHEQLVQLYNTTDFIWVLAVSPLVSPFSCRTQPRIPHYI